MLVLGSLWFTRKSFTNCTLCLKQRLLISDNLRGDLRGAQVSLLVTKIQTPVLPLFSELSQCKAKKTAESPSTSRGAQKELKQPSRACTHEAGPMMALPTQNGDTFNSMPLYAIICHYMPLACISTICKLIRSELQMPSPSTSPGQCVVPRLAAQLMLGNASFLFSKAIHVFVYLPGDFQRSKQHKATKRQEWKMEMAKSVANRIPTSCQEFR